jgi:hypothetical protein
MGKQYNKVLKRRRLKAYNERKKSAAKAAGMPKAKTRAASKKTAEKAAAPAPAAA